MASRRCRHYALRAGYAAVLILLILVTWGPAAAGGSGTLQISRMPEVARTVTTTVVWFQFVVAQAFAVVMLSSAVSEEIRKGTLGVLLTTPITSLQIVVGKLLSRMLQVLLLLAMSLPMLAVLRVLGGVPWEFVLAGVCITLSATLLIGSGSLWLSTYSGQSHKVVTATMLLYAVVLGVLPRILLWWSVSRRMLGAVAPSFLSIVNPVGALYAATMRLWSPGVGPARAAWPLHCLVMLSLTLVLLVLAVRRTRKAAITGLAGKTISVWGAFGHVFGGARRGGRAATSIKRVKGSPIVWRETRRGLVYGWSLSDIIICVLALLAAVVPPVVFGSRAFRMPSSLGFGLSWILSLIVFFRLVTDCAGSVPRERDARTWPILLATPLEDKEIVYGKAKAALLHSAPLIATVGLLHLWTLFAYGEEQFALIVLWSVVSQGVGALLVVGIGSCFGVLVKTRAGAVAATIGVFLGVKYGAGFVLVPLMFIHGRGAGVFAAMFLATVIYILVAAVTLVAAVRCVRRAVF